MSSSQRLDQYQQSQRQQQENPKPRESRTPELNQQPNQKKRGHPTATHPRQLVADDVAGILHELVENLPRRHLLQIRRQRTFQSVVLEMLGFLIDGKAG